MHKMKWFAVCLILLLSIFSQSVAASSETSVSFGLQTTYTAVGSFAELSSGPFHIGAGGRYDIPQALRGFLYQEILGFGYFTKDIVNVDRISLTAGLGVTSWIDFGTPQFTALVGLQTRGAYHLANGKGSLILDVLIPVPRFITWEKDPQPEWDDWPSSVGIMSVYLLFQLVSIGYVWSF
jgi:hypothetical protein